MAAVRVRCWGRLAAGLLCALALGCAAAENPTEYLKDLDSPNPFTRQMAARELGTMKERLAVAPMLKLLAADQPDDVRLELIGALGKIGDASATPALVSQLVSGSGEVRRRAAEAVGRLGDRRAVVPLINFVRSAPDPTRMDVLAAIWALGNIGDMAAMELLLGLKSHPDKYVAYNASQALKKLGH